MFDFEALANPAPHIVSQRLRRHLNEAGVGVLGEIFDAEPPFPPRGCIPQAWSVAEVLRRNLLLQRDHA